MIWILQNMPCRLNTPTYPLTVALARRRYWSTLLCIWSIIPPVINLHKCDSAADLLRCITLCDYDKRSSELNWTIILREDLAWDVVRSDKVVVGISELTSDTQWLSREQRRLIGLLRPRLRHMWHCETSRLALTINQPLSTVATWRHHGVVHCQLLLIVTRTAQTSPGNRPFPQRTGESSLFGRRRRQRILGNFQFREDGAIFVWSELNLCHSLSASESYVVPAFLFFAESFTGQFRADGVFVRRSTRKELAFWKCTKVNINNYLQMLSLKILLFQQITHSAH